MIFVNLWIINKLRYMKQNSDVSDHDDDSDLEDQSQLMQIDNLLNYIKQINKLIRSAAISQNRHSLKKIAYDLFGTTRAFDKYVEDYNESYLKIKREKLIHFKIEQIALGRQDVYFIENVEIQEIVEYQQPYFAKLVFCRARQAKYYQMHIQLWKRDNQIQSTNSILTQFQKCCMYELLQDFNTRGFVSSYDNNSIAIITKKPIFSTMGKSAIGTQSSLQTTSVLEFVKISVQKFLKQMKKILISSKNCSYCQKHLLYESRHKIMIPPTMLIYKQKSKDEVNSITRLMHESCALEYLKAPSLPTGNSGQSKPGMSAGQQRDRERDRRQQQRREQQRRDQGQHTETSQ